MELGSLPGGVIDKLYPYLAPMADHLGSQIVLEGYIESGKIEPVHLGFLRGRDLRTIVERLSGNEYFGYVRLKKSERSKVAALADLLD